MYSYRICGNLYHVISDINRNLPSFSNTYLFDPNIQLSTRLNLFESLDTTVIRNLQSEILSRNPLAAFYSSVLHQAQQQESLTIKLLHNPQVANSNLPTSNEIAMIVPGDGTEQYQDRSLILRISDSDHLKFVSQTHSLYDPLQYVIMFPSGTLGWHPYMKDNSNRSVTALDFYRYQLFPRVNNRGITMYGRLFHQFVVDMAVKMESLRFELYKK